MNDLISKQAALDALEWKWAGKAAIDAIKGLPTIDPVKHGKWKNKQMLDENLNPTIAFRHRCSECGFEICTTDETIWWHFCPNCGAKVDGGEDEQMD